MKLTQKPKPTEVEAAGPTSKDLLMDPTLRVRLGRRLGLVAVEKARNTENRPRPEHFDPRATSGKYGLREFTDRNAALGRVDLGERSATFLNRTIRKLAQNYDKYIDGSGKPLPNPDDLAANRGFSRDHADTIFQWNLNEASQETAEDLLYVMDATPSGDAEELILDDGWTKMVQEYTSSTGLNFIDVREVPPADNEQGLSYHRLLVYLPPVES